MKTKINLKTILFALFLLVAGSTVSFAQCDKTATFTASKTTYLNDKGIVERVKDKETVITFNKKEISVTTSDDSKAMTGDVKTYVCNWAKPYKTGKTVITTVITDGGREMHATDTIEGKDGKVSATFEVVEMPGKKIQYLADKFE
jgi:hypothetical protein